VDRPLFSVVIPTRQRAETLRACLETCLAQDFDDYEILVVDNASTPETRSVVVAAGSDRVRYLRSDRLLAMSANWELAVSEARGEYVTVVGDDDALMPYALRELARLIAEHDRPGAVRWSRGVWTWPTIAVQEDANCLFVPMTRSVEWLHTRDVIAEVIAFRVSSDRLPMIYNSVIRRDVIDQLRDSCDAVFPTIYPDIYSGFALGTVAGRYLSTDVPMGIAGLGGRSNGVATLMQAEGRSPIADEFNSLNRDSGYLPHPRVPDLTNVPVHIVDSFEHARDRLFPGDVELDYDRWEMTQRYLATITAVDEAGRKTAVEMIKATLDDRPELRERVDDEAALHSPAPLFRFRPERLGFDGTNLVIDTAGLGIDDVADCSRFVMRLLGFDARPIEYGLPDVHRLAVQLDATERRAQQAESRAEDAERRTARAVAKTKALRKKLSSARSDASLRRVPRRVVHRVTTSLRRTRSERP
jgi:glycosyltransferase involved in cell wall biosynthesis